jgi:hypothetical protein
MVAHIISRIEDASRRAHVAEQLRHPGLSAITEVRWFAAMCPDGIKWGAMNTRVRGMRRQSAFGCLLSHFHVLQQCYLNGLDALIFEDDFLPMPGFVLDIPTELGADMYYPGWITWGAEHAETPVTADWHRRYRAVAAIHGHLHIPLTEHIDGVRHEEVSLGYPRERAARTRPMRYGLRRILTAG